MAAQQNPLTIFRTAIAGQLSKIIGVEEAKVFEGVDIGGKRGDFSVAVPRFRLKEKPDEIAKRVVEQWQPNQHVASVTNEGVFLHFHLNTSVMTRIVLNQINDSTIPSKGLLPYGWNKSNEGKKAIIEFSSPNIAKPFHAGHLRSTIIGAYLSNFYEANGWNVMRMNYLGDWGKQFGLLAVGFNMEEPAAREQKLAEDPIRYLYNVYKDIWAAAEKDPSLHDRAREFFKKMEDGDPEAIALWTKFRDLSIEKYKATYARLNVHFDVYSGESQVSKEQMNEALDILIEHNVVSEDFGSLKKQNEEPALVIDLEKYRLGKTIVRKSDGTTLYITRDIGGAIQRWNKYKFDKMIYVIGATQEQHTAQFFKALELMGFEWANRMQHINFGSILGMSTRKGTAKFLEDIMNHAKEVMHTQMKENAEKYAQIEDPERTSDIIGMTGVKVQDMTAKRINNYKYTEERMFSFEGDFGPFLQYQHVRMCSVERKAAPEIVLPPPEDISTSINTDLLTEPAARNVVFLLSHYPEVVINAYEEAQASTLTTYLFKLTRAISSAWETLIVKGADPETAKARLFLYVCARTVLSNGMKLLTLEPLDRM
ncbi:arginyl-tRNA synthetase [Atractiella rhizophila]|nr:arginyl-tRNA synthetase [Atractiella rhizophila]